MVASLFLEKMGPLHLFSRKTNEQLFCAAKLAGLLENEPYQLLFDSVIARYGGWTALVRTPSLARFDKHISALRKEAHTTAKLIEYQFRYMEHGGADEKMANISHAMFFLYKGQPPIYGKTLRNRWRKHKKSSVFVYASELLGFNFYPPSIRSRGFLENLSKAAVNLKFKKNSLGRARTLLRN